MTEATKSLFLNLWKREQHGNPMLNISNEQRGNLTQLKRNKLVSTYVDEGVEYVTFSESGKTLASKLSVNPITKGEWEPVNMRQIKAIRVCENTSTGEKWSEYQKR